MGLKKIFCFTVCLFCLTFNLKAQEKTEEVKYPETTMIKTVEVLCFSSSILDPKIIIIDSDGGIETKPLDRSHLNNDQSENFQKNALKIKVEIQKWQNKGFQVKSMSSYNAFECTVITTILLQKN